MVTSAIFDSKDPQIESHCRRYFYSIDLIVSIRLFVRFVHYLSSSCYVVGKKIQSIGGGPRFNLQFDNALFVPYLSVGDKGVNCMYDGFDHRSLCMKCIIDLIWNRKCMAEVGFYGTYGSRNSVI